MEGAAGKLPAGGNPATTTGEVPVPRAPGLLTTRVPDKRLTWPEKLFELFVSARTPLPVRFRLPVPEMTPPKEVRVVAMPLRLVS